MSASGRRILAGLFWLLASLGILLSTVVVWAHQSLLTTSGWTQLVGDIFDDPAVVEGTADGIVERVAVAIDLPGIVARVLPGESELVAGLVTTRVEDFVAGNLATALGREDVRATLGSVNAAAHEAAIRTIRGGGQVVSTEQGSITLNVFPLVEAVLVALQGAGIIDETRQIPDLSEYRPAEENVARLESLLGWPLPEDIGTIELVDSGRLATVQQAVRTFDLLTIGVLAITAAFIAIAIWLSRRRLRMVVWLALGAIAALTLGRGFTRLVVEGIGGSLADGAGRVAVRATIEAAVDQIMWLSLVVIAFAVLIAGVAMWLDRRRRARPEGALPAPRTTVGEWVRDHHREMAIAGLAVIAFFVLWRIGGPDVALLAAAATGIWLIAVSAITGRVDRIDPATGLPADPWMR
jgi:hypothetical protein